MNKTPIVFFLLMMQALAYGQSETKALPTFLPPLQDIEDVRILTSISDAHPTLVMLKTKHEPARIYHYCTGEIIQDSIQWYQRNDAGYGWQNMVVKTGNEWMLALERHTQQHGWQPVRLRASDADAVTTLQNGDFLLEKKKKFWYGRLVKQEQGLVLEKVRVPITDKPLYFSQQGFLAACPEGKKDVYRFFTLPEDTSIYKVATISARDTTLSVKPGFRADAIVNISDYQSSIVYQSNGKLGLYSIDQDSILDTGFTEYKADSWHRRVVVRGKDYFGVFTYDQGYKRMTFGNVTDFMLRDGGDAFFGYVATSQGTEYMVDFINAVIGDSLVVSPELRRMMPNGFPYMDKIISRTMSGTLQFAVKESGRVLSQTSQGEVLADERVNYVNFNHSMCAIGDDESWYINLRPYSVSTVVDVELFPAHLFDKVIPLDYGGFLGTKGKKQWLIKFDEVAEKYSKPIALKMEVDDFTDTGGGLLFPEMRNGKKAIRYLRYYSNFMRLVCNPATGEWQSLPLSNGAIPGMVADSILLTPDQTDGESLVFKENGQVYVLYIDHEKVIKVDGNRYQLSPFNRKVLFQHGDELIMGEGNSETWHVPDVKEVALRSDAEVLLAELTLESGKKHTIILDKRVNCR